ncbi:hypothetical protein CVT24_005565 [Panaeolus cyanescens]|uniref:Glycoside hydrolase family 3 C-terminal domain-containing protein n=1 Tax=Panaeolus cyanescens TaxID=181874 RepID=A0A409VQF7_9AGAR|nr:hypothetical protein CVT24_005565 [Panaeolus cyanescens]
MLFSLTSVIYLLSLFSAFESVYSIPLIKGHEVNIPQTLQRRAKQGLAESAVQASNYIKKDRSINKGKLCFYSGSTEIGGKKTPVYTVLDKFTKQPDINCRTLPDLLLAGNFKEASNTWHNPEWTAASKAMASRAKGIVIVLLGETVLPTSVWEVTEKKALQANPRATGIQVYIYKSDGQFHKGAFIPIAGSASRSPTPSSSEGSGDEGTRGRGNRRGSTSGRGGSRNRSKGPANASSG